MSDGYVPLWCRSAFSFLEGASRPDELVDEAARLGLSGIALTDRDGLYGVVRAHLAARQAGIPLLIGATVTVDDARAAALDAGDPAATGSADSSTIVLLATDRAGYGRLCGLISRGRRRAPKGQSAVRWEEVYEAAPGLVALWGGEGSALVRPAWCPRHGAALHEAFGDRLHALVTRHRVAEELEDELRVRARARTLGVPCVAGSAVLYHAPERRELQDVLTCIRHGVTLSTAGRLLRPNAAHALHDAQAFRALFADDPDAVARTLEVAARCRFSLTDLSYRYPLETVPGETDAATRLRQLTLLGAADRYLGHIPPEVHRQLEAELSLIEELHYSGYFLTMHEIVSFCRVRGILCQGRGSAANSAVCYCLGITAIDPVRTGLLFERFLSRERAEPPDIDLDISHERREEVIQHVYERYGRDHAAMVANVIRYRPRSAVRDVGRALGIPATALDRLARLLSHRALPDADTLRQAGLCPGTAINAHLLRLSRELVDLPRHLSIHPGGFLLGSDPVHTLVPIENATMPGRTVIQWDKDDVEAMGLFKVDLLGLGALSLLDRCFALLREHHGLELDLASIPPDDDRTYDLICAADTVGVFQIESRAQMAMLPRLQPRTFHDLVIEISIVRPGPISGDMVHPYLRRRQGIEPITYPHPCLVPVLEKTLGIPLFQEQVMRLAMVAADYTPGEADQLRRDMAAWRSPGRMEAHRERLLSRMTRRGISPAFAERVFEQIRGFGEYGFPESHAASFALISYATAWLRAHYPTSFTCALLNAQPLGFYTPATLIDDAKRHGVVIHPLDIHHSAWDCSLEPLQSPKEPQDPYALRLGARYLSGLSRSRWDAVVSARAEQPFASIEDLARRTGLDARSLQALAESGALNALHPERRQALWEALAAPQVAHDPLALVDRHGPPDLGTLSTSDTIAWDYHTTRLSSCDHPLAPLREVLDSMGLPTAETLNTLRDGTRVRYAGFVICRQRPGTASGVVFMTLEDETGFVNLVLWPGVFEQHSVLARTTIFLGVSGRIQRQDGVCHLIAERLWRPRLQEAPPHTRSRDFH